MKRLCLLVALLCCPLLLCAQGAVKSGLDSVGSRFGVKFIYDSSLQPQLEKLKGKDITAVSLQEALAQVFEGTGITWQVRGDNVILKPGKRIMRNGGTVTLSGYITDAASSETLISAGVLAEGGSGVSEGAVANEFGYYTLSLPAGRYSIVAAHLGYESSSMEVDLRRDTTVNFSLKFNAQLDAARIVSRKDAGIASVLPGSMDIPVLQLRNAPALLGEADLVKSLQLLPGVQGGFEGLSGMYVRGGGPEENLILLDGVPVYSAEHMLGLFSIFQPEAVKDVTLYKGAFPARYGGRVSSILDIRTNDGNMKETHGSFTVGLLNDKIHMEGPIVKDTLSYSLSARGLHTIIAEPFLRLLLKDMYVNYYYFDLNGKLTWRLSDSDRLYLGVYYGRDNAGYSRWSDWTRPQTGEDGRQVDVERSEKSSFNLGWGSAVGSLRWNHVFSGNLFSNTTLFCNNYLMNAALGSKNRSIIGGVETSSSWNIDYNSGITDLGVMTVFDWTPLPSHLVRFGAEYIFHNFRPEVYTTTLWSSGGVDNELDGEDRNHYPGHELALYAEDNIRIGTRLTLNPGLRLALFSTQGRIRLSPEPRAALKFDAGAGFSVKGGYSRMAQYVHLLSSTTIPLPLDIWVPITRDIKPVTSDQWSLGAYYDGLKGWEFSVEGYLKNMHNLLEFKEGVLFLANTSGWENQVESGEGRAMGLELLARKTAGATTGWVSYTLAGSTREFPDGSINLGRPYPYKYDRRHSVNVVVNHKFSDRVDISASWVFYSGGWMSVPMRETTVIPPDGNGYDTVYHSSGRNNYNLPSTHRLNVGVNLRRPTKRGGESVWNLSLYNAYNAMNPNVITYDSSYYIDYDTMQSEGKGDMVFLNKTTVLPIIPAFSYTLTF